MSKAINILVLDEECKQSEHFSSLLTQDDNHAINLTLAQNSKEALNFLQTTLLDCIIIRHDIHSFPFIQELKENYLILPAPIILVTSEHNDFSIAKATQLGVYKTLKLRTLSCEQLLLTIISAIEIYKMQIQLEHQNKYLRNVLDNLMQGVCVYDKKFHLTTWNKRFIEILKLPEDFLQVGRNIEDIIRFNAYRGEYGDGDPETIINSRISEIYNSDEVQPHCYDRKRTDGSYLEVRGNRMPDGGLITTYSDVTARKKAEQLIQNLALNDSLTGLANRNLFHRRLEDAINHAKRNNSFVALLLLDLDRFKAVNDTYGHPIGDSLLKAVASRLAKCVRSIDTIARLGGDEFAIILTQLDDRDFIKIPSRRILDSICNPFDIEGNRLLIGTSIGISFYPDDDTCIDELIRKADLALYEAKTSGRGNYQIYDYKMDEESRTLKILEDELRQALPKNELTLHYQPQYDLSNNKIIAVEIFIRWHHPRRGLLTAGHFLKIAESCGLMIPIGEWLLKTAGNQIKEWNQKGIHNLRYSINLSMKQFQTDDIVEHISNFIKNCEITPELIELEINENSILRNTIHIQYLLETLQKMGISLAIGNFGIGCTTFSNLKTYPISRLKLDSCFIKELNKNKVDETIIISMINMAHSLCVRATAVGVENEAQIATLRDIGCDEAQGNYFAKPMSAEAFYSWYKNQEK